MSIFLAAAAHVAPVAHVVVDSVAKIPPAERGLFGWNEPTWAALGAIAAGFAGIATALMAIFTLQLALRTRNLAEETGTLIDQAERHHQEGLMPIVFISVNCTMERLGETGYVRVRMLGEIANVGPGAATNVEVIFKPIMLSGWRMYVGILGPNSRQPFSREWRIQTSNVVESAPFESLTLYRSVFGATGAIEQASGTGRADDARVEWSTNPSADGASRVVARIAEKFASAQRI